MTARFLHSSIFILALVLFSAGSPVAQEQTPVVDTVSNLSGIEIETSVDKAEIYIGDLITYKVSITYDSAYELIPPPLGANLGSFDVKDYQSDIITKLDDGRIRSDNIFKLSTFTTGDYVIPPIPAIFNLNDGSRKALLSEAVPIKVQSLLLNVDDSTDINPLKAQFEFQRDYTMYYVWGSVIFLALLIAAYFIWRFLRKRKEYVKPVDPRKPWEISFEQLALLKQKNLINDKLYKQYYIELTEIIRSYLQKIYQINVLDMTTEEFLEVFSKQELPGGLYTQTESFLKHADLIKFAKFIPETERTDSDYKLVHDMIDDVRLDYEKRQREQISIQTKPDEPEQPVEEEETVS